MSGITDNSVQCQICGEESLHQRRGRIKIFFGYTHGVGKTCAMLQAAHDARRREIDVVVGCADTHGLKEGEALLRGLELLPGMKLTEDGQCQDELDLDGAIARRPQLMIVDELAHKNAPCCRHAQRYQDIEELLAAGIDVYTTADVQNIESLNDVVASVTGEAVKERIPDSVFDNADQVEFIDIEPKELLERQRHDRKVHINDFSVETLTALREIALRRCADQSNMLTGSRKINEAGEYHTEEHILVCLSSSPSNAKIIRTAARMASAFHGTFTALFVETPDFRSMTKDDLDRLRFNMNLARRLDAKIETVFGDDIPIQIAEFARLSGVTKIVIGRSAATRKGLLGKPTLTDKLIANAPNLDVHVIPDAVASSGAYRAKRERNGTCKSFLSDIVISILILIAATLIGFLFERLDFAEANIITVYVLGVLITSVVTSNRVYSLISSLVSVLVFNFFFTDPKFTLEAYGQGYPVTFIIMFIAAFLTGTLAIKLKNNAKQSAQAAYRTKILFDANQMIQQAIGQEEIFSATANQLTKLLKKDIVVYPALMGRMEDPKVYSADVCEVEESSFINESEREVAEWVFHNNKHAGATTQTFSSASCLYLAIRVNDNVYGVLGIVLCGSQIEAFEHSILLSILGECALALENDKNAREKEEAAILAKNEQLRANLLRAISHDLRTPLTSISGNASNLLSNADYFDSETKHQLYSDIYNDSLWLINLVENLLSVTRLEEGRLNLHISENLVDDVITEALRHVNRQATKHKISVRNEDDFLLAKMDAKLLVQVVINIVDNAIKYTPENGTIEISTRREGSMAVISIADNGPGMSDEIKAHVFEMFYCGANQVADSRRSLGLGLSLCKSIISAHGGSISVSDNVPHGAVFTFTLPVGEVTLHE